MKPPQILSLTAFLLIIATSLAVAQTEVRTESERRMMIRAAQSKMRSLEMASLQAQGSTEIARLVDLGNAGAQVIESSLPAVLDEYDLLLRGPDGLLTSDAGRYHSQNTQAVETILRYSMESRFPVAMGINPDALDLVQIDFGPAERKKRAELLIDAVARLKAKGGAILEGPQTQLRTIILDHSGWAQQAFDLVNSRNAMLQGYFDAVPSDVDVSSLPTLEEEIQATFARRISVRESLLNQVEKEADERKTKRLAEVTAEIRDEQLQAQIAEMRQLAQQEADLSAAIHARISADLELRRQEEVAAMEQSYQARVIAMERELAEQKVLLARHNADVDAMEKKVEADEKLRALPANAAAIIGILSAKGNWKPVQIPAMKGRGLGGLGVHYGNGLTPQAHSLTAISAAGALDDTTNGIYIMYAILATELDTMRPRFERPFPLARGYRETGPIWSPAQEAALTSSSSRRATTEKIRRIQALLREYGRELVAKGLLKP